MRVSTVAVIEQGHLQTATDLLSDDFADLLVVVVRSGVTTDPADSATQEARGPNIFSARNSDGRFCRFLPRDALQSPALAVAGVRPCPSVTKLSSR